LAQGHRGFPPASAEAEYELGGGAQGPVQRLKQHNLGANLRISEGDLLLGFRRPQPHRGTLRVIRLHVELGGYAERAYHEIAPSYSHFSHRSIQLDEARLGAILTALRVAFAEQPRSEIKDNPNGDYRTLEFRDGSRVLRLRTEYTDGSTSSESPALDAAWTLLEEQFPADTDA
jgi:hypothetical protein